MGPIHSLVAPIKARMDRVTQDSHLVLHQRENHAFRTPSHHQVGETDPMTGPMDKITWEDLIWVRTMGLMAVRTIEETLLMTDLTDRTVVLVVWDLGTRVLIWDVTPIWDPLVEILCRGEGLAVRDLLDTTWTSMRRSMRRMMRRSLRIITRGLRQRIGWRRKGED
uniref:Uncharacterized protein n=1 Tax=Cacopsylla melanoneura TaxID=428564 RepID=A0A8D8TYI8_9HEMI